MLKAILSRLAMSDDMYMPLVALCFYLFLWKKIGKHEFLLLLYLILNVIFGAITNVMGFYQIHNLPLYHFYTLFEQWFLSYYILTKISGEKILHTYLFINISFTIFFILNIIFWEPLDTFNSNTAAISSLILLFLCMYYMLSLAKEEKILYFQKIPSFWIISGFLIYSALTILIFTVYNYYVISNLRMEGNKIMALMHIATPAKYIFISIGLLCYKKPTVEKRLVL